MSEQAVSKMNEPVAETNNNESQNVLGVFPPWTIGVFVVVAAVVIWKMWF